MIIGRLGSHQLFAHSLGSLPGPFLHKNYVLRASIYHLAVTQTIFYKNKETFLAEFFILQATFEFVIQISTAFKIEFVTILPNIQFRIV